MKACIEDNPENPCLFTSNCANLKSVNILIGPNIEIYAIKAPFILVML